MSNNQKRAPFLSSCQGHFQERPGWGWEVQESLCFYSWNRNIIAFSSAFISSDEDIRALYSLILWHPTWQYMYKPDQVTHNLRTNLAQYNHNDSLFFPLKLISSSVERLQIWIVLRPYIYKSRLFWNPIFSSSGETVQYSLEKSSAFSPKNGCTSQLHSAQCPISNSFSSSFFNFTTTFLLSFYSTFPCLYSFFTFSSSTISLCLLSHSSPFSFPPLLRPIYNSSWQSHQSDQSDKSNQSD